MLQKSDKIIVTGAAGLVGQNLVLILREHGYSHIIAIDKHAENLTLLQQLNPGVRCIHADLSIPDTWSSSFENARCIVMLHAQITSLETSEFEKNNITATRYVIAAIQQYAIDFTVHVSSSVVKSVANDDYTNTKRAQEKLVLNSGIACCILRPTLLFGWFDPKHLGWLSRFMEKTPLFPIPGNGKYLRQPLYSRDFCRVILAAMEKQLAGDIFDIVGLEAIHYIDLIYLIKKVKQLNIWIVKLPYTVFYALLKLYALISKKPPFTADQLKALTAGDYFTGVNFEQVFEVIATPLHKAFEETFTDNNYSQWIVKR